MLFAQHAPGATRVKETRGLAFVAPALLRERHFPETGCTSSAWLLAAPAAERSQDASCSFLHPGRAQAEDGLSCQGTDGEVAVFLQGLKGCDRKRGEMKGCLCRGFQASPAHHGSPTCRFPRPGESGCCCCCTGMPQMPRHIPLALKRFPGAGPAMAAPCPGSVPCPSSPGQHSTAPTHRCTSRPASPCFGPSGAARQALGTELCQSPLLPSTLPAAQPPALPAGPRALLPLIRAEPGEGQQLSGAGLSEAATKATCVGRAGRGRPRPCAGQLGLGQPQGCSLVPVQRRGLGPGCPKRGCGGCGSPMNLTAASRKGA